MTRKEQSWESEVACCTVSVLGSREMKVNSDFSLLTQSRAPPDGIGPPTFGVSVLFSANPL